MPTGKKKNLDTCTREAFSALDHALNHMAAAVANLHEAAVHLRHCHMARSVATIEQAREEIRKSWRAVQELKHIQETGQDPEVVAPPGHPMAVAPPGSETDF
ncbi:MAG: hypothetical protein JRI59_04410 [Deltaproteobacteria bacterium]|nr:hypothetical protein [Deltaproteobacteria bacterium]